MSQHEEALVPTCTGHSSPNPDNATLQQPESQPCERGFGLAAVDADDAVDKKRTVRDRLAQLARGPQYFVSTEDESFVTFKGGGGHNRTVKVKSPEFSGYLAKAYLQAHKALPPARALDEAMDQLSARAHFADGTRIEVYQRLGEKDGVIYVDLGNEDYEVAAVTADGWAIVRDCPIKFRRSKTMLPLPHPEKGGSLDDFKKFVNVSDADWPKVAGFIVGAMRPDGPYPILEITGEQGSAKSTTCEFIQRLLDPTRVSRRSAPRSEQDLAISFRNSRVVMFDNLSRLKADLSDLLCRASTGGAWTGRKLYTDDGEVVFNFVRPIIINGIEDLATRADLLERMLTVELPRLQPGKRRPEGELRKEFEVAHPKILGALLDAVAAALGNQDKVHDVEWPRLADFARWVTNAEEELGWTQGTFLAAMQRNEQSSAERALGEDEDFFKRLKGIAKHGGAAGWTGTASQLLDEMGDCPWAPGPGMAANALSRKLRRLAPPLRNLGVEVSFYKQGHESTKFIKVAWVPTKTAGIDGIDGNQPGWEPAA